MEGGQESLHKRDNSWAVLINECGTVKGDKKGKDLRWERKLEGENDIFEAIMEAETEEEMNEWKYTQGILRKWNEQDSE